MPKLQLRDYQEECVQAHYDFFEKRTEGNPIFVVPTGGGKSLIMAEFIRRTLHAWPETRILVATHVKELIEQNHDEFLAHWDGDKVFPPCGIYSASVGKRDTQAQVLFAGIQSIWNKVEVFGAFDLVLIDEAHLVPKRGLGRYRSYLDALAELNPKVRVCGYTATPYRLDGGYLYEGEGRIFTHVAYTVRVEMLIERGYLAPLAAKKTEHEIDVSRVGTTAGDFKVGQLEAVATEGDATEDAVDEMVAVARAEDRHHWLVFAIGRDHAAKIRERLDHHGIENRAVFGTTGKGERFETTRDFKEGRLQCLVNVGVLTTGFNAPRCDLMAVMRPTQSAALYVQIMGRGMRTFPGKEDCLVLDYGGNVERHGPINRVRPKKKGNGKNDGIVPMKVCPECETFVELGTPECPSCGFEWSAGEISAEHERVASVLSPIDMEAGKPQRLRVSRMFFRRHTKPGSPDSLRVDFLCGMRTITDWVCVEHEGFAGRKAVGWWSRFGGAAPAPSTVDEALERQSEISQPSAIDVVPDGNYERVKNPVFESEPSSATSRLILP